MGLPGVNKVNCELENKLQSWTEYIGTTTKTGIFLVATSN